nr:CHY zinc finger protein [Fructobacillus pseudoficulneus]
MPMYGLQLGEQGTCEHYHSEFDIAGLKCRECQRFYACYQCHDDLEKHQFVPTAKQSREPAVLCGHCGNLLTFARYKEGHCPSCGSAFNPKCALHESVYFS